MKEFLLLVTVDLKALNFGSLQKLQLNMFNLLVLQILRVKMLYIYILAIVIFLASYLNSEHLCFFCYSVCVCVCVIFR